MYVCILSHLIIHGQPGVTVTGTVQQLIFVRSARCVNATIKLATPAFYKNYVTTSNPPPPEPTEDMNRNLYHHRSIDSFL